ncbi:putative cystine transporter YijE [Tepidimonas charontis]|uniref:Putative cystine transporter YijE n=2 Tax=Tepidimonas charontis TaxID=2267262 RepID=A0A554X7P8_9BURK|nr:putative cystine transporter YijE [Tepidimonas charontis]
MPVWTVLLGALFFGQPLTRRSSLAALAVVAAVGLLLADELGALAGRPIGVAVMLGAAISWAIGTLMMRRAQLTLPVEALTVWMMLLTAAALWALALTFEPWPRWQFSPRMWGLLAYGVLMNYGFAQIIWFSLARHLLPATSAMSVMMVPLIGTISATFIAGEWPRWTDGVAMVCVMAAIATVLLPPAFWRSLRRR